MKEGFIADGAASMEDQKRRRPGILSEASLLPPATCIFVESVLIACCLYFYGLEGYQREPLSGEPEELFVSLFGFHFLFFLFSSRSPSTYYRILSLTMSSTLVTLPVLLTMRKCPLWMSTL
jgi:hypothetical protein